jgi:TRAP-type C4-dicarboxylate transport system substrate-binding protein
MRGLRIRAPAHIIVAALALVVLACGAARADKIDMAIFHPERSAWTPTLKWWMEEVDKATQGHVQFVPHYAGALVTVNETLKAVRDDAVPSGVAGASGMTGQIPSFGYLEAIGGLPDKPDDWVKAMADLHPVLEDILHKHGVEYLWAQSSGALNVVCRKQFLKSVDDWKGRKVRTAGRWQAEQIRAIGGSAVALDPSEQYLALQNGTVDCALSINILALALKLHEVAPDITLLRLPVNVTIYIMNSGDWNKLAANDRAAIKKIGAEAEKRAADYLAKADGESEAEMKAQKAQFYRLSDAETAAFRKGISPAFDKMAADTGDDGKRIRTVLEKFW